MPSEKELLPKPSGRMLLKTHPFLDTGLGKDFRRMFWVSLIAHFALLSLIVFSRRLVPPPPVYYAPPAYTVDLVTIERPKPVKSPGRTRAVVPKKKTAKKILIPKSHKKKVSRTAKKVKPKPKKAVAKKKPLKKYSEREIRSRIASLKKKVAVKRIAEQEAIEARGKITSRLMEIKYKVYQNTIYSIIDGNYEVPRGISIQPDVVAIVTGEITKEGKIRNLALRKRSGNEAFDHAVIRSLEKSSPLPPPPGDGTGMEFEMRFSPGGLQK